MKVLTALSLLLAGTGASVIPVDGLDKRQLASLFGTPAPAKKAVVLKKLQPQYNQNATRAVYMYGPFKLPASNVKHGGVGFGLDGIKLDPNSDTPGGAIEPPCKDCTVHSAMANFAYKDGTQTDVANGVYIHHIIVVDYGGKMQLMPPVMGVVCPDWGMITPMPLMSSPTTTAGGAANKSTTASSMHGMSHSRLRKRQLGMSVFIGGGGSVGSGNPFSPKPGSPIKSGYWIGSGGGMQLTSEIVNYDPVDKEIYLTLDVEWSPGKDPNMLDVGMGAVSADRCDNKERSFLHPPKDKPIVYKGEDWPIYDDGYFINFTPHLHDGGVNVKVFVNNKEVCESKAVYGNEGGTTNAPDGKKWQTITGYTPCENPIQIKKGDKIHITSEYDLTKYRLRPDNAHADAEAEAMAMVNFIFAKPFPKGWFW